MFTIEYRNELLATGTISELHAKPAVWLEFKTSGLDSTLLIEENARHCVELLDMCAEYMKVENCVMVLPKRATQWLLLAEFLIKAVGAQIMLCSQHDPYDWMVLRCDL